MKGESEREGVREAAECCISRCLYIKVYAYSEIWVLQPRSVPFCFFFFSPKPPKRFSLFYLLKEAEPHRHRPLLSYSDRESVKVKSKPFHPRYEVLHTSAQPPRPTSPRH